MLRRLKRDLEGYVDREKAALFPRFFKAGKGEYAEGDRFIGVTVPHVRAVAKEYRELPLPQVRELLSSPIHEHRLTALVILVLKFRRAETAERDKLVRFYLKHLKHVNNWDLVDASAPYILGQWLLGKDTSVLDELAASDNLWERRVAILATFPFIKLGEFSDTLRIAERLVDDPHDLIHKAVGWMLREVGKRSPSVEERFLRKHHKTMPRTMLRYALEKFDDQKRRRYMAR